MNAVQTPTHSRPAQPGTQMGLPLLATLLLCVLTLLSLPAHAKRVALVVGNAAYADKPLRNPVNDAELMQRTLQGLGFDVSLVRNADRRGLLAGLRDFEAKARNADVALFYFAGHGTQVGGNNYLLPLQAQIRAESDVPDEAVDANSVLRRIEDAKAKVGLVILDACRDNPYAGSTRSSSRGLGRMSVPTGSIVAYATAPGSTAEDGSGRNGVYTEQLARQLATPGLDLREVFDRTATEVERITGGKQKPREDVGLRGRVVLKDGPATSGTQVASVGVVPTGQPVQIQTDPEQEAWELARQINTAAAFQGYLNVYPSGRFASPARVAIAGLQPPTSPQPKTAEQHAWDWVGEYVLPWKWKGAEGFHKLQISGTSGQPNALYKEDKETPLKEIKFSDSRLAGIYEQSAVMASPR